MRTLITVICLAISTTFFAQQEKLESDVKMNTSKLEITTDDLKELKTIDWKKVLSVFEENTDRKQEISVSLTFERLEKGKNNKVDKSISISTKGTPAELEKLKLSLELLTRNMISVVEKHY